MSQAVITCSGPLLEQNDILRLHPHFHLQDNALIDRPLGARHTLHPAGRHCLQLIHNVTTYAQLVRRAQHNRISMLSLDELLAFVNMVGGLMVQRTPKNKIALVAIRLQRLCLGISYSGLTWRHTASLGSIISGTLGACQPIIYTSIPVACLLWGAGALGLHQALGTMLLLVCVFISSLIIHEYTHVLLIRRAGMDAAIIRRGMRLGVIHSPTSRGTEQKIACSGPVAGIAWCIVSGLGVSMAGFQPLGVGIAAIACFHVCSLLPWYGDGKSVFKPRKEVRHA